MKIAAFTTLTGIHTWGVIDDETNTILSAQDLEEATFTFLPETIDELIEGGDEALLMLATAMQKHREAPSATSYPLQDVLITQPLQVKKNIICVGLNYDDHVGELQGKLDNSQSTPAPTFFSKAPTAVIGPNENIHLHAGCTNQVDYEGELAVIIGKRGSHITEEEAYDYIFGYTIINDVSARDLQKSTSQWFRSKSLDTFAPMGPYILISEKGPKRFEIKTEVNGELRQHGTTDDFIHSIPNLIATWSQGITLEPGAIIATGTPSGVGMSFNPPRFLQEDDQVSISISDIGTLTNTIIR